MAIINSFIAQALTSIANGKYFCYSAISSSGVVLILPGFLIRELAVIYSKPFLKLIDLHHRSDQLIGIGVQEHCQRFCQNGLRDHLFALFGESLPTS